MNSHDLTLAAFKGTAEKIPFNPFIMHFAASFINADYSNDYCQHADTLATGQIKCAEHFGVDHVNVSTDAFHEASAWGVEIDWSGNTPDGKTYLNPETFDQVETPDLNADPRILDRVEGVRLLKERTNGTQCVFGWIEEPFAELCCLFGITPVFLMARHSDWDTRIKQYIDRITLVQLEFAKMQIEAGADVIGAGDSIISQIGPRWYQQCAVDATQVLFDQIKRYVPMLITFVVIIAPWMHKDEICFKLSTVRLPMLLILTLKWISLYRQKIDPCICIRGNTNTQILGNPDYSIEQVIHEVQQTISVGLNISPYMYGAGCEWPWSPRDMAIRNISTAKTLCERAGK